MSQLTITVSRAELTTIISGLALYIMSAGRNPETLELFAIGAEATGVPVPLPAEDVLPLVDRLAAEVRGQMEPAN